MTTEQLRTELERLHAELGQTTADDPQRRELLRSLESEVKAMLDRETNQPHHYTKLGDRFNEGVAELEASHPQITLLLRRAIDSLSYLGI
jgi:CHASE3 domain sensor protein